MTEIIANSETFIDLSLSLLRVFGEPSQNIGEPKTPIRSSLNEFLKMSQNS